MYNYKCEECGCYLDPGEGRACEECRRKSKLRSIHMKNMHEAMRASDDGQNKMIMEVEE